MLTNWPVSICYKFLQKRIFETSYWNLDFNSYNSTKYVQTLKKSTLNMTKFVSLKKVHTKITMVKRNLELNDLEFLCYSAKACRLDRVYIGSFFNFYMTLPWYHQDGTSMKGNSKFSKLSQVVHKQMCRIFWAFSHLIFKREKRNEVAGCMKWLAINNIDMEYTKIFR